MVSRNNERKPEDELDEALWEAFGRGCGANGECYGYCSKCEDKVKRVFRDLFARLQREKVALLVKDWIHKDEVRVMLRKARTIAMYRLEPDEATDAILREHGHGGPDDGMAND